MANEIKNKKGQSCQTSNKLVATMKVIEAVTYFGVRVILGNHETREMYVNFVSTFKDEETNCFMMEIIPKLVFLDDKIRDTFLDEFGNDEDAMRAYELAMAIRDELGLDIANEMLKNLE